MIRELNCRGLACPEPVMQVKDILEKERPVAIAVLVDNRVAKDNVSRFLTHQGFRVQATEQGGSYRVAGTGEGATCEIMPDTEPAAAADTRKILVMVGTARLGHGDDTLGAGLMFNFLKTLKEMGPDLWRLVLVNDGVKLTVAGADAVPVLRGLADSGVSILVCGTCLNHFKLLDKKEVGETTNMLDIVTSMQVADSVINI